VFTLCKNEIVWKRHFCYNYCLITLSKPIETKTEPFSNRAGIVWTSVPLLFYSSSASKLQNLLGGLCESTCVNATAKRYCLFRVQTVKNIHVLALSIRTISLRFNFKCNFLLLTDFNEWISYKYSIEEASTRHIRWIFVRSPASEGENHSKISPVWTGFIPVFLNGSGLQDHLSK
jgi:hypothetical protein